MSVDGLGSKKPLLCRIGLHSFRMRDMAMFNGVDRCPKCLGVAPDSENDLASLTLERQLWTEAGTKPQAERTAFVIHELWRIGRHVDPSVYIYFRQWESHRNKSEQANASTTD